MSTSTTTDADFTLEDLYDEGIGALKEQSPAPHKTYEVAPGVVGTMPYPSLRARKKSREIREELRGEIYREDADGKDFQLMTLQMQGELEDEEEEAERQEAIEELEDEGAESPIVEGITSEEFEWALADTNTRRVVVILDFDQDVDPQDINPEMASVVVNHFTRLAPMTENGQKP